MFMGSPRCDPPLASVLAGWGLAVAEAELTPPPSEREKGEEVPRTLNAASSRPGVRVVSVFSRTLGRLGGRGGPLRRGLNL